MKKWWNELPSMWKLVLILIALAILIYFMRKADEIISAKTAAKITKSEIEILQDKGVKATYKPTTYKKFANNMFEAMDGIGTNTNVITAVFSYLNNDLDFIHLDAAFGVRGATDNLFGMIDPTDMRGWLKDDLSEELIASLNKTLANKGITKRI